MLWSAERGKGSGDDHDEASSRKGDNDIDVWPRTFCLRHPRPCAGSLLHEKFNGWAARSAGGTAERMRSQNKILFIVISERLIVDVDMSAR